MSKRRDWTELGCHLKEAEIAALQHKLSATYADLAAARGGSNSVSSDNHADFAPLLEARDRAHDALCRVREEFSNLRRVYVPRTITRGQVGALTTVKHRDPDYALLRGETETFLLGGPGELFVNEVVRIYPCNEGIGKAVVLAEVGDIVTGVADCGRHFDMEVMAFAVPNLTELLEKLKLAA